ncbi:MAG: hypothetical protein U0231_13285 [Nitrospiraceae bacterium]
MLQDGAHRVTFPLDPAWGSLTETGIPTTSATPAWSSVFDRPLVVSPQEAFSAVLLYPQDEQEIGELETQPFVADYLQDLLEQNQRLGALVAKAAHVEICRFDAAITTLIGQDRRRSYHIQFEQDAFVQRQAQAIWNQWARAGRLAWLSDLRMRHATQEPSQPDAPFDLLYDWVPYRIHPQRDAMWAHIKELARRMTRGAIGFLVGPPAMPELCGAAGLQVEAMVAIEQLPTFRMHRTIIPKAMLRRGVTLYQVMRR